MNLSPSIFQAESELYTLINDKIFNNNKFDQLEIDSSSGCYSNNKYFIGSFSGQLYILSSSKRVEKMIEAHNGCITNCIPFNDCIVTSGEDGTIKLWTSNGTLRSTIAKSNLPVNQVVIIGNEVIYSSCNKLHASDIYSNVKKTFLVNFVISSLFANENSIFIGGFNGKLKVFEDFKSKSECQLDSKINTIFVNHHLKLIYCGVGSKLVILDFNLVPCKSFDVSGILSAIYALDNGQIHFATSLTHSSLAYFKDTTKNGYYITFKDGFEIEELLGKKSFKIDQPISNIRKITVNESVFVELKNKVLIFGHQELSLDLSFEIREIYPQISTFCILDDLKKLHVFTINGKYLGNIPFTSPLISSNSQLLGVSLLNEISFYDYNLKPVNARYQHDINIRSFDLNENGLLLLLDEKHQLYLSDLKTTILVDKQVHNYKWGKESNVFCYSTNTSLIFHLFPFISLNLQSHSQIVIKYQTNIKEILEFNGTCLIQLENGDIKSSNVVKPYIYKFLDLLNSLNLQDANKIAMTFKKDNLYACLLQAALIQNDHDLVLQCCVALKMFQEAFCLVNFSKQFALELVKNKLDTTVLGELEQYQKELEAFRFAKMLPMVQKSVQNESLFAHYRKEYLTHLGQEELVEEYKNITIKMAVDDVIK